MEYAATQRKSSYLKILGMFKLKNHNIFPWKSVTCICLLFHNDLLTMHVFLVFRGGKAPLWFLLYWLHTGLLPYVSLYAERTIRIIRMQQQYFSTECRKMYSTLEYIFQFGTAPPQCTQLVVMSIYYSYSPFLQI
jgi:hypothetical protein